MAIGNDRDRTITMSTGIVVGVELACVRDYFFPVKFARQIVSLCLPFIWTEHKIG